MRKRISADGKNAFRISLYKTKDAASETAWVIGGGGGGEGLLHKCVSNHIVKNL